MDIKLDLFKVFNEVAKEGSFSAAGKTLFISQSAISQSINNLETAFSTKLFHRLPKGIELTNEGKILFEYTSQALNMFDTATNHLNSMKKLEFGELRIGAGDTITSSLLIKYLEQYHNVYPSITIKVYNQTSYEVIQLLKEGKIDIGFVNLPIHDESINVIPLMKIHDIFVAGKQYAHLYNKKLSYKELVKHPLILIEKGTSSRDYLEFAFKSNGVLLNPELELGSHDLLLSFANINFGISCVIKEFSMDYIKKNNIKELDVYPRLEERYIGIATLKNISYKSSAEALINLIKKNNEN